ncbi:MAG TPA: DbpA RNA binding domain-containing protein [Gemmatimonadales bacterium]
MAETENHHAAMAGLQQLGWDPSGIAARDVVPPLTRGSNLVVTAPPAPAYAAPALAGVIAHTPGSGRILVVAPSASLAEWAVPVGVLTAGTALAPLIALGPGQAARRFRAGDPCGLLVGGPATLLDLQRRSLLPGIGVTAIIAAWPELWEDREALTLLLSDVPKEAQRVVITSTPDTLGDLIERHAWRAFAVGEPTVAVPVAASVRTVPVAWSRRIAALGELAEVLEADSLAVWTADDSRHGEIRQALQGLGVPSTVSSGTPAPAAQLIAFDPPTPPRLADLCATGPVSLLAPPGTEGYLARIASNRKPLLLPGAFDAATGEAARRRDQVERTVREGPLEEPLVLLGPLFERHDPTAVAAALYQLWVSASRPAPRPAVPAAAAVARLWIGAGKRDGVGPNDFVGLLAGDLRLDRSAIGQIEVRETFSLVEVPGAEAARIAAALTGRVLRQRRIVARVDERPASRERPPARRGPRVR